MSCQGNASPTDPSRRTELGEPVEPLTFDGVLMALADRARTHVQVSVFGPEERVVAVLEGELLGFVNPATGKVPETLEPDVVDVCLGPLPVRRSARARRRAPVRGVFPLVRSEFEMASLLSVDDVDDWPEVWIGLEERFLCVAAREGRGSRPPGDGATHPPGGATR